MSRFVSTLRWGVVPFAMALLLGSFAEAQQEQGGQRGRGQQGQGQGQGGFRGAPGGFGGFRGGPGGGLDKVALIGLKQVQDELHIGGDQMIFVNEVLGEYREKSREMFGAFGNFREMSEADREKAMAEMRTKREKLTKESEEGLAAFLDKDQARRLDEISLQVRGTRALADDDVAGKLKLSDAQKGDVKVAFEAADADMRKAMEGMRGQGNAGQGNPGQGNGGRGNVDFAAMREKMDALRKQSEEKVLAVLTAEQKAQFETLKGRAFELDRSAMFGGGRGGRPGGDNGGRPAGDGGDAGRPRRPATE